MKEIIINAMDYITEEEIKEIVVEEFKAKAKKDIERILANMSYHLAYGMADAILDETDQKEISQKVKGAINKLDTFTVFSNDSFNNKTKGYIAIENAISKHNLKIENRIAKLIEDLDDYDIFEILKAKTKSEVK